MLEFLFGSLQPLCGLAEMVTVNISTEDCGSLNEQAGGSEEEKRDLATVFAALLDAPDYRVRLSYGVHFCI